MKDPRCGIGGRELERVSPLSKRDLRNLAVVGIVTGCVCALFVVLAAAGLVDAMAAAGVCAGGLVVVLMWWAHLWAKPRPAERGVIRPLVRRNHEATMSASVTHVKGLPLPAGARLTMYYEPGRVVFRRAGQEVVIPRGFVERIELRVFDGPDGRAPQKKDALLVISHVRGGRQMQVLVDARGAGSFASRVERDFASPPSHLAASGFQL